jgi:NADPH:quinone reductase-like Zn-dependent oxidoreductase
MKAIIYSEYGGPDVLHLAEVAKPQPKPDEVLIKIHAVSVNYGDVLARKFKYISPKAFNMPLLFWVMAKLVFGLNKPKKTILGNSFAGIIEEVGDGVKNFHTNEPVFACTEEKMGAYAEYMCMPENGVISLKPTNMTFEEASIIPYGASMALNLLKKGKLKKGQHLLVLGASGGIGSAAVQLAKHYYGAAVTGVCSTDGLEYVKKLGADKVIDYTKEDYTKSGETYDLIFDVLGSGAFSKIKASLTQNGIYLSVSFKMKKLLQMLLTSIAGGKRVVCNLAVPKSEDLIFIRELIEEGKMTAIIDKTFPMEQAAVAHRYFESGNKKGSVVIKVNKQ